MTVLALAAVSFNSEEFVALLVALVLLLRPGMVLKMVQHIRTFRMTPTAVEITSRKQIEPHEREECKDSTELDSRGKDNF
jgi:hypothetical protein